MPAPARTTRPCRTSLSSPSRSNPAFIAERPSANSDRIRPFTLGSTMPTTQTSSRSTQNPTTISKSSSPLDSDIAPFRNYKVITEVPVPLPHRRKILVGGYHNDPDELCSLLFDFVIRGATTKRQCRSF
jgi:hypothetical protein